MASTEVATSKAPASVLSPDLRGQKTPPGRYWAAAGVLFLAVQGFAYLAWFASGEMRATPIGPSPLPDWMHVSIRALEVVSVALGVAFVYKLVYQPWSRNGRRLTLDGLLCLAFLTLYWQDPLCNYVKYVATYNTAAINLGSWTANVPGWLAPHGNRFAEPFVWVLPGYLYMPLGGALLGCWLMRRSRNRWPGLQNWHLVAICYGAMFVFDFVIEFVWMRMGAYSYIATIPGLTLFKGRYFQFPMTEAIVFAATITLWSALRFFLDDKGTTVAERGLETGTRSKKQTGLRWLAMVGIVNTIYLLTYQVPMNVIALHSSYSPPDVLSRSYFTNGLCGPGTGYECGGQGPVNLRHGSHVNQEGNLIR